MRNYTKIPNEILEENQLSIQARYLYCLLLKFCGKDEYCFPSQETLATVTSNSTRYIRNILKELIGAGIVEKKRRGWNRSNNYRLAKSLTLIRNGNSVLIGSVFPLHPGNAIPPKSTYLKGKGKTSKKGLEKLRKTVDELRSPEHHPKETTSAPFKRYAQSNR